MGGVLVLMDFDVSSHPTWTEVLKDSSRGLDEADATEFAGRAE